ncbi:hypothetical protein T484DRAFT_1821130 [Baffinella frigidus]|nr:hypothetical protein T484DRAFT_1821130 [Cryptophyta sp. CCMP2293]
MTSLRRFERTRSKSEQQIPRRVAPASPQQPAKASLHSRGKAKRPSMFVSLWSLVPTLPGVSSHRARSCEEAAPIELPSPSRPVLRAAHSAPSPTIDNENVSRFFVRSTHRYPSITIQLPSVRLAFLHDASPIPEDCVKSQGLRKAYADDLFRGRSRSIEDLAGMIAWLDHLEAREI